MKRFFLLLLLSVCQLTAFAQQRRPIDSQHPLWLIHIDVWNSADPQKIINLVPDDIKPYVCFNLSLSCGYDTELNIHTKPQDAIRTYKSWASICQNNGLWFTCQPASGGHTHIQDWDIETFEYFFKTYPNFLGWNYAEQFWGFNEAGDKFSSSDVTRIALFAKLVEMSHNYGGFLTVSFCGNIWSHLLNPSGMMKRNPDLLAACKKYPEAILWLYKYTTSSCFYNNESVCFGPFVAGLAKNYGVRYDNCGYNGALDAILGENHGRKYPVAAGIGTVMEQTCQNGGAVWDGPELIWTEDFQNLSDSKDTYGYTIRNWGRFPGFDNAWIDMFRKIIDGTMYIPTQEEVVEKTKFIVYNDITSGNDEDKYAMWGDAYDNLYKQKDPFNKGNGQWMDNYWYLKKTGRYGTLPMTPAFNTGYAEKFTIIQKSKRSSQFSKAKFDAAYPIISTGDLFVSRFRNQLVTYTPYTYLNSKKTASANIPLEYNTCESLDLTYGKLSSGIVREFEDSIVFYLNNYRSDTIANVTDRIVVNGVTSEPSYSYRKRANATGNVTASWDEDNSRYTITVSHNGPFDITVKCKGDMTDRKTDAIAITPLSEPVQPEKVVGPVIVEAEDMDRKDIGEHVYNQYDYMGGKYRDIRGHSALGFVTFGGKTTAMLKAHINILKEGEYNVTLRYSNTTGGKAKVQLNGSGAASNKQYAVLEQTSKNEWQKHTVKMNFTQGNGKAVYLINTGGRNIYIDYIAITPADCEAEKFGIFLRGNENGETTADYTEAEEGTVVTLSVTPNDGYEHIGWNIIHGDIAISDDNTFVMPDDNVTLEPIFKDVTLVYDMDLTDCLGGSVPPGWVTAQGDLIHQYPNTYSSGARIFTGFNGTYFKAFYWPGDYATYGTQTGYPLTLQAGDYVLKYTQAAWKGTPAYKAVITTKSGSVIASSTSHTATPNANGSTAANLSSAQEHTLEFTITTTGNYIINLTGGGGWNEYLLLACSIHSVPDETEITEIVLGSDADKMEIYDITGKRLPSLQHGINIIRMNGDDVRKVFIK